MFFESFDILLATLASVAFTYVGVVLLLRLSGKRTLAKWNAFDFVVTIALGSIVASTIVSDSVSIMQGLTALVGLVLLQVVVTSVSVRARWFRSVVKGDPVLLLKNGRFLDDALRKNRVTRGEVLAAIRENGIGEVAEVAAVVLENEGRFSVIKEVNREGSALEDVVGWGKWEF